MSKANVKTSDLQPFFHPAAHYDSPHDVLSDEELSVPEKRIILSSWASDIYAVESCPALCEIRSMSHKICLVDILAALRQLENGDPQDGELAMRQRRRATASQPLIS
jgi:hypothetical protein